MLNTKKPLILIITCSIAVISIQLFPLHSFITLSARNVKSFCKVLAKPSVSKHMHKGYEIDEDNVEDFLKNGAHLIDPATQTGQYGYICMSSKILNYIIQKQKGFKLELKIEDEIKTINVSGDLIEINPADELLAAPKEDKDGIAQLMREDRTDAVTKTLVEMGVAYCI